MSEIKNPHDRLFKRTLADPQVVRDFIQYYLPEEIAENIEPEECVPLKGTYVDEKMQEFLTDIVYRVKIAGKEGRLCLLFEHKSYRDPRVTIHLLGYMSCIWDDLWEAGQKEELPIILPVLFHHGIEKWTVGPRLSDLLVDLPEWAARFVPDFEYFLFDVNRLAEEEIRGSVKSQIFLRLLRMIRLQRAELLPALVDLMRLLDQLMVRERDSKYFDTAIIYILTVRDDVGKNDLQQAVRKGAPERGDQVVTLLDNLRGEGKFEMADVALRLHEKFGEQGVQFLKEIRKQNNLDLIDALSLALESAETLEELRQAVYKNRN